MSIIRACLSTFFKSRLLLDLTFLWNQFSFSYNFNSKINSDFSDATVDSESGISIEIEAPFYDDPKPNGPPGPFYQLWDYEVVEAFFLSPKTSVCYRKESLA